jgi:UDP-N-acetylmuramoyl-tripeptide--D-alanyl-D-alanine ligase
MRKTTEEIYSIFLKNRSISTDSRQLLPGCLFFALKGENFDGNKYAQKAIEAGAAYAVIDDENYDGPATILVDDVLITLQNLANMHRRHFKIPVVAITGSNGKTTTKELLNAVLSQKYKVTATKGNLNNHIGVPLTLLGITDETQLAIIEMGANHQGEIAQLCAIAEPTHGLITNIGKAHLDGFGGYEGVIKAKSELYSWLRASGGVAFVNSGNQLLMELTTGIERTLYGTQEDVFARGKIKENTDMMAIDWITETGTINIETNLAGNYNFENVMAAICAGMFFEVPLSEIRTAISSYFPSNSRSQVMKTAKNSIILDAYNANPTSMQAAIENLRQVKAMHKMVILGDMLELGDESLAEHSALTKLIEESDFENVILVGPDFTEVAHSIFTCFRTSDEARDWLKTHNISGFTILVKGSRGIKMEKVLEAL